MADDHYFPLFWGDFLAATGTWSGPQRGLYVQLLAHQWSSGPLPDDLEALAIAVGYKPSEFMVLWRVVGQKFKKSSRGLVNDRVEEIRRKNSEIREARRHAGHKSQASRPAKEQQSGSKSSANDPAKGPAKEQQPFGGASVSESVSVSESGTVTEPDPKLAPLATRARASPLVPLDAEPASASVSRLPRSSEPAVTPEMILAAYPHTANGSKSAALHAIARLIDSGEATPLELMLGTRRFANFVEAGGRSGPQYVKSPQRFYERTKPDEPAPWSQAWEPPQTKAQQSQDRNIAAVNTYLAGGKQP